jgi:hypothetical protein
MLMSLLARLVQRLRWWAKLPQLAEEVGRRRSKQLASRIAPHRRRWPDAELRGYVRGVGGAWVRRDIMFLIEQHELPKSWQSRLTQLALEALVTNSLAAATVPVAGAEARRRAA